MMSHSILRLSIARSLVLVLVLALLGCRPDDNRGGGLVDRGSEAPQVYAVCYALQFLTQEIVGDFCEVEMPNFAGQSPDKFRLSADRVRALQKYDLIVTNGGGAQVAGWLNEVSLPNSIIMEASEGVHLSDFIVTEDAPSHSHGPEGEHSHNVVVATTWLDPKVAMDQAEIILNRLQKVFPEQSDPFQKNYQQLRQKLSELQEFCEQLEGMPDQVLSAEPSFKYLLRRINVNDQHFFWTQEKGGIDNDLWQEFDEKRGAAKLMLWPTTPAAEIVAELEKRDIAVEELELLIEKPATGDYVDGLRANLKKLSRQR